MTTRVQQMIEVQNTIFNDFSQRIDVRMEDLFIIRDKLSSYLKIDKRTISLENDEIFSLLSLMHIVASLLIGDLREVQREALVLFKNKNSDYGDAFAEYGVIGVLVRLNDKISRLSSLTSHGVIMVKSESMRDTLIDIVNYSAMAIMLERY